MKIILSRKGFDSANGGIEKVLLVSYKQYRHSQKKV